jgi:antitoxin VapB
MRTARLFKNGQSQAVRLPKDLRFEGARVQIMREGNSVVLRPLLSPWQALLDSLEMFSDDFMGGRHQPSQKKRREAF